MNIYNKSERSSTNNVLPMEINIIFRINRSQKRSLRSRYSDFTKKIASYLAAQGGLKEQRGKILSGSGKNEQRKSKKIEGKWRDEAEVTRKIWIWRLLWKTLSYPQVRFYEFVNAMDLHEFSRQFRLFLQLFSSGYYGKDQSKYYLRAVLRKLVGSTFGKNIIQCSHQVFIYSIVYIDENCRGPSNLSRL